MKRSRGPRLLRAGIAGVVIGLALLLLAPPADARAFSGSRIAVRDGNPTLLVDGRPFFFYGAAFFYERIPAPQWRASMLALQALGFNTLDLYVPWNWHELADGDFDFDGHTNARRNLRGVLTLARELGFKFIVRPGPVIRNEWRNGGYPAWLLTRPEYGMPLHDVLEGRYPATATLQNANSDDAAAQWLGNATHMRYASRWLRTVLREFEPVADLVVAVQLDDDQGAYIDNQTWPAPHFQTYLRTLETVVRSVVGQQLPVFINTYEMKVTASAPVWAMGNWYQSDAYSIGEHDRAALEFSTGLLQTQTRAPVAMSEFQAGWLAAPEDPTPRPADPTNTTLALHTLLGLGTRGVIDFPAQDTVNPAGWEAPFANADYAWDAALGVDLRASARYLPTRRFGDVVRAHGAALAAARRYSDGAIAYLTSAYDQTQLTNADVFGIVARTQQAQQACRAHHLVCDLIDLRFIDDAALHRYPFLIVPREAVTGPMVSIANARLTRYRKMGGRVTATPPDVVSPHNGGIPDATVLLGTGGDAFVDITNYDAVARTVPATPIHLPGGRVWTVGPVVVPARDAVFLARDGSHDARIPADAGEAARPHTRVVAAPIADTLLPSALASRCVNATTSRADGVTLRIDDRAADGYARVTLENALTRVILAPNAGGRAFSFMPAQASAPAQASFPGQPSLPSTPPATLTNAFTSVGALRDDVAVQPPLSTADRIGKYTRSFPAGFFNRDYALERCSTSARGASVTLTYAAPDVVPNGARFERTVSMTADEPGVTVTQRAFFAPGPGSDAQRAVRYDSLRMLGATLIDDRLSGVVGVYDPAAGRVAIVAWPQADVESAQLRSERTSVVLRLVFAPGGERRTRYMLDPAEGLAAARSMMLKERSAVAAKRETGRGGVAKW